MKKNRASFFNLTVAMPAAGLLILSCLNPIGFNPDFKLQLDVNANISGEVGIDSVNSTEIQLRNHTKSIDIYRTDIVYIDNGASSSGNMAARITGAPVAGSQESILLRPIGPDANTKYQVKIWYRQAAGCPSDLNRTAYPSWDWGGRDPDKTYDIPELPRGRYVIHVYRTTGGDIGISVEDDTSTITEMEDKRLDGDYVADVKVNSVIDLSGASINVKLPSGGLNVNADTMVSFSPEVTGLFTGLIDAINNNKPYPDGYGVLLVRNHTSKQLSNIEFDPRDGQSIHSVGFAGLIRAEDQERFILKQGKWEAQLTVEGTRIGPKNAFISNQGKEFLHVYKNKSGGYSFIVSEKEWSGDLIISLADADSSYSFTVNVNINGGGAIDPSKGTLFIHNMTARAIDDPKMHIESVDLSPAQAWDLAIGAKATIGGMVDPSNYTVSVGVRETTVFVSHMTPTHVYYYKTRSGDYGLADYWPPHDADQSAGIDVDLGPDQAIILVKNRSGYIVDSFTWMGLEYEIQLTSGDDVSTVVEAGSSPVAFKVRNGSYGEDIIRTVNPGQVLTITVQGSQIININPPVVITPPSVPTPAAPRYDQTIQFKHETGFNTPIEYLVLYRDNGVAWKNTAMSNGYVSTGNGVYHLYTRTPGSNAIAPDIGDIAKGLPNRPSNYGPTKGQWVAAPIHGLDDTVTGASPLDVIGNKNAPSVSAKISAGSLGKLGNYAVKIKGDVVSTWKGTPYGKNHPLLEINDSVIIQFDPPLQRHEVYKFKLNRGTRAAPINWFVSWVGAHHNGAPASNNIRYNAGYFGNCWFILCPWYHDRSQLNITAKGVALRYQ
jgi:hypothetical protein